MRGSLRWVIILLHLFIRSEASCVNRTAHDVVAHRDLTGQTHVITGGCGGIGYATAEALLARNATIIMGCKGHTGKYAEARAKLQSAGNDKVSIVKVDLSSFSSVRAFATELKSRVATISSLVCNAGILYNPRGLPKITEDGFERVFQVNFLSHFLLIEELLPVLRSSQSRVLQTSSVAASWSCSMSGQPTTCMTLNNTIPKVPPKGNVFGMPGFFRMTNYGLSKFLQVFHAAELARREPDITSFALTPGVVSSNIASAHDLKILCGIDKPDVVPCPVDLGQGAATSAYMASATDAELLEANGQYFIDCEPADSVRTRMIERDGSDEHALVYQKGIHDIMLGVTQLPRLTIWNAAELSQGLYHALIAN